MPYEYISNLVKGENGDVLADSPYIFNRWKNSVTEGTSIYFNGVKHRRYIKI
jgi:hypothetical protein